MMPMYSRKYPAVSWEHPGIPRERYCWNVPRKQISLTAKSAVGFVMSFSKGHLSLTAASAVGFVISFNKGHIILQQHQQLGLWYASVKESIKKYPSNWQEKSQGIHDKGTKESMKKMWSIYKKKCEKIHETCLTS